LHPGHVVSSNHRCHLIIFGVGLRAANSLRSSFLQMTRPL
jgi:hypothetical protein